MTIKKLGYAMLVFVFAISIALPAPARAQTATADELIEQIKELQEKLAELQAQMREINAQKQQLRMELKASLREGMSDEDIKKIQELLATDPEIYPQGLVTGYFGPLTKEALKRFQQRLELKVSGEIDEETREYLEELLEERFGDKIPPGLLRAPGILKKVELRMKEGCDDTDGLGILCAKLKAKHGDDDEDEDEGELEIEVEFEDGDAKVKIRFEDGRYRRFTVLNTTDEDEVIDEIVERTDLTEDEVRDVIEFEDEDEDEEDEDDEDEDDDEDDS